MRFLAKLSTSGPACGRAESNAAAFVTSTDNGWLLTVVLSDDTQRLVGGYLAHTADGPSCVLRIHGQLRELARRLSCDQARLLHVAAHVQDAARSLERTLGKAGLPATMPLSARQLRIATRMLGSDFGAALTIGNVAEACGISLATFKRRLARAERQFLEAARDRPELQYWLQEGTRWGLQKKS